MMTCVDLTHTLTPGMPVYPNTQPPTFTNANTIERHGFAEKLISMYSHTGTHVDAPAHMLAGGATLDRLDVRRFVGPACVIDVSAPGVSMVPASTLDSAADLVAGCQFVLFHTGWSERWGQDDYFSGFPVLSLEAARWLALRGLSGVGFDAISADPVGAPVFENHFEFFRAGMLIVENLTGLRPLVGKRFTFSCLPLKLQDADGSPVRAVALG
jgi:kynurenine formamidase